MCGAERLALVFSAVKSLLCTRSAVGEVGLWMCIDCRACDFPSCGPPSSLPVMGAAATLVWKEEPAGSAVEAKTPTPNTELCGSDGDMSPVG